MSIPIERRPSAQRGPNKAHNGLEYKQPSFSPPKKEVKKKVKKEKPKKRRVENNKPKHTSSGLAMDGSLLMVDFGDGTGMGFDGKLKLTL